MAVGVESACCLWRHAVKFLSDAQSPAPCFAGLFGGQLTSACSATGTDLSTLVSPLNASTRGLPNEFHVCPLPGSAYGVFVDLQPGETIIIRVTANFRSTHAAYWADASGGCQYNKASNQEENLMNCGPANIRVANTFGHRNQDQHARRLWVVVEGYVTGDAGEFSLWWNIQTVHGCSQRRNLSALTSPFVGQMDGAPWSGFSGCGEGPLRMFFVDMSPNETISIRLTYSSFASKHA